MNFTNANLSKLDLRYINFKYAVLKNANLSGANLSYCNFERADLCHAVLDVRLVHLHQEEGFLFLLFFLAEICKIIAYWLDAIKSIFFFNWINYFKIPNIFTLPFFVRIGLSYVKSFYS